MKFLLIVAIRVGGLFLVIHFLSMLPNLFQGYQPGTVSLFFFIAPYLLLPALGLFLWLYPNKFLSNISPENHEVSTEPISAETLQVSLISVVAVYLLFDALADLTYYVTLHLALKDNLGFTYEMQPETKAGLFSAIFSGVLALFLLVKSSFISSSLQKLTKAESA